MAQQVLMYAEEAQTQINTLMAYNNLIQNTVSLPVSLYHDITSKVQQITGFVKQAELTNGYSGDMLSSLSAGTYALDKVANFPTLVANENKAVGNAPDKGRERPGCAAGSTRCQQFLLGSHPRAGVRLRFSECDFAKPIRA